MPFRVSVPKASTASPHRKVTVESVDEEGVCFDLKEFLLACCVEPKDALPAFGADSLCELMRLSEIWDVVKHMHDLDPTIFENAEEPILKVAHYLLVRNTRPEMLCRLYDTETIHSLLTMQVNWEDIKTNYHPKEPTCDFCGADGPVLRCSGCMEIRVEVRYCNKECQMAGWKSHKKGGCGRYASEEKKQRVKALCRNAAKRFVN